MSSHEGSRHNHHLRTWSHLSLCWNILLFSLGWSNKLWRQLLFYFPCVNWLQRQMTLEGVDFMTKESVCQHSHFFDWFRVSVPFSFHCKWEIMSRPAGEHIMSRGKTAITSSNHPPHSVIPHSDHTSGCITSSSSGSNKQIEKKNKAKYVLIFNRSMSILTVTSANYKKNPSFLWNT